MSGSKFYSFSDLSRVLFLNVTMFESFSGLLKGKWSLRFISWMHLAYAAILVYIFCQYFTALGAVTFLTGVTLTMILIDRFVDLVEAARMLRSVVTLSNTGIISSPRRVRFANYLGGNTGGRLDWGALENSTENSTSHVLFFMKPMSDSIFVSTFCMNINPHFSIVFLPYNRDDLNPQKLLIMLHEFGHTFMGSWERTRNYYSRLLSLTILSLPLLFLPLPVIIFFCAFLFLYWGSLWHAKRTLAFVEEALADARAAKILEAFVQLTRESMSPDDIRTVGFAEKIKRRRNSVPVDKKLYGFHRNLRQVLFKLVVNGSSDNNEVVASIRKSDFREGLISWFFIVPMLAILALIALASDSIAFNLAEQGVVIEPYYPIILLIFVLFLVAAAFVLMLSQAVLFGKKIARRDDARRAMLGAYQLNEPTDERVILDLAHEFVDFEHIRDHLLGFGNVAWIQHRVNEYCSEEFFKRLQLLGAKGIEEETPVARWEEVLDKLDKDDFARKP